MLSSLMDLLELATLFHLRVVNNPPLAFVAFAMFSSAVVHDATHCDVFAIIS